MHNPKIKLPVTLASAGTDDRSQAASAAPSDNPARRNHIIVCELQTLGFRVAEQLRAVGLEVIAIEADTDHSLARQAQEQNIQLVEGDDGATSVRLSDGDLQNQAGDGQYKDGDEVRDEPL